MLQTVIPSLEELWFKQKMMADEETMAYNHAYGGTIPFPVEKWQNWYDRWIVNNGGKRYYRYLMDESGEYVGEISYRYDEEYNGYVADVVIFSEFRHKGYGSIGLELLCDAAKGNGISVLYDDIAIDNTAVKLFLSHGFTEMYRTEEKIAVRRTL